MMKKSLAKILVLVLLVALLAPSMANAATTYTVDVALTGPSNASWSDSFSYQADTATINDLIMSVLGKKDAIKAAFSTATDMQTSYQDLKSAAESSDPSAWESWITNSVGGLTDAQKAVLKVRTSTLAEVDAVAASDHTITTTFNNYTLSVKLTPVTPQNNYNYDITPTTPSAAPAEEPVVVDASDVTEGEPVVVEEAVEVADSAEEAKEIVLEDIPEDVKELSVEVALEAPAAAAGAEPAEVSENTTVLAVKDKDGNVKIIPMAVVEIDEDGNITAKGSLNEELTELLKDGGSLIAYDNEQEEFEDVKAAVEEGTVTQEEADAVAYWQARGVIEGVGGGNLGGLEEDVERARFVTLLHRAFGAPATEATADYADLTGKYSYAQNAASWAAESGLMNGIGVNEDGEAEFGTGPISAWQMALVMFRSVGGSDEYPYEAAWNWAVSNGLMDTDREDVPNIAQLSLIMQRFADVLDGGKLVGDQNLETPALED